MKLSGVAVQSIREAVQAANGIEICGFLVGHAAGGQVRVERTRPVHNIYASNIAFAVCEEEYRTVLCEVDSPNSVVGIYHLHYGAPHLSCVDRRNVLLHELSWLIVNVSGQARDLQWKCFRPKKETIIRVAVEFDDGFVDERVAARNRSRR